MKFLSFGQTMSSTCLQHNIRETFRNPLIIEDFNYSSHSRYDDNGIFQLLATAAVGGSSALLVVYVQMSSFFRPPPANASKENEMSFEQAGIGMDVRITMMMNYKEII